MFSDIEGSTALNEKLGDDKWLEVLTVHDRLVRHCIRARRGQVIKTLGDLFMAAFADPTPRSPLQLRCSATSTTSTHRPTPPCACASGCTPAPHRKGT